MSGPPWSFAHEIEVLFIDPKSRRIVAQLDRIAPSEASVLLVGETGTGKEVVARQIHARSGRKGPFVAVNCGALTESLGEAALFGHEIGAFTGAHAARAGWFETAHGGTLFLDEIGDLPPALQVALLRVLQERHIVRLGSRKPIPVDIRVIAATNADVAKAVREETFRLDLYFRLSVVTLAIPPLRERPEDILPLALHFARRYSERLGYDEPQLHSDARRALREYAWPGNVRELENVMHGAVLVASEGVIRAADLKLAPWLEWSVEVASRGTDIEALAPVLERLFDAGCPGLFGAIEAFIVKQALKRCNGNQVHSAKLLGLTRHVLRRHLRRHGLLAKHATAARVAVAPAAKRYPLQVADREIL